MSFGTWFAGMELSAQGPKIHGLNPDSKGIQAIVFGTLEVQVWVRQGGKAEPQGEVGLCGILPAGGLALRIKSAQHSNHVIDHDRNARKDPNRTVIHFSDQNSLLTTELLGRHLYRRQCLKPLPSMLFKPWP